MKCTNESIKYLHVVHQHLQQNQIFFAIHNQCTNKNACKRRTCALVPNKSIWRANKQPQTYVIIQKMAFG